MAGSREHKTIWSSRNAAMCTVHSEQLVQDLLGVRADRGTWPADSSGIIGHVRDDAGMQQITEWCVSQTAG